MDEAAFNRLANLSWTQGSQVQPHEAELFIPGSVQCHEYPRQDMLGYDVKCSTG